MSGSPLIRRHWPYRFAVRRLLRGDGNQLAATILDAAANNLVILTLGVERNARPDTGIVGDIGRAYRIGQRFRIGRTGTLVSVGCNQQGLERINLVGVEIDTRE